MVSFQSVTPGGALGMAVIGLSIAERLTALGHDVRCIVSAVSGYRGPADVRAVSAASPVYLRLLSWLEAWGLLPARRKRHVEERLFDRSCRAHLEDGLDLVVSTNSFAPDTFERARSRRIPVVLIPGNPNDLQLSAMTASLAARHRVVALDPYSYAPRQARFRRTVEAASLVVAYSRVIDRSFADLVPDSQRRVHPALLKFKTLAAEPRHPDRLTFGYLGYTVLLKGLDVLLAAWESIYATTDARLTIGGGVDPSVRAIVDRYYADRERYRIDFIGEVGDVRAFFAACSVVVVPSYVDGQPTVAVEAMALGRPVVVTTGCGVSDFVRDTVNGRVVPAADPLAMAEAMRWFADAPGRVEACGREARVTYDAFDFPRYIDTLTDDILAETGVS